MNISKELNNGILIFISIGIYFLFMELLGLSDVFLLRLLNIFIVVYFINKTIKSNYREGKTEYFRKHNIRLFNLINWSRLKCRRITSIYLNERRQHLFSSSFKKFLIWRRRTNNVSILSWFTF